LAARQRWRRWLRIGHVDPERDSLFEFRRVWLLPPWSQVALVAGSFVATVLCTYAEYRRTKTVFGFPGPGFNVLVAPIYEELIFRGWILGRLVRNRGNGVAIAVSSLLFGLLHLRNIYWLDPEALVRMMAFTGLVAGPVLGYVTLRCRSVWPAVILHYLNNLGFYL
jgi:membrane protease YdiL (CAAX protease family)